MNTTIAESIKLYAKLLKVPTFAKYSDAIRKVSPDAGMDELLLELMKTEYTSRQDNQHKRRIRDAGFTVAKMLDELEVERFEHVSPMFIRELASCDFVHNHQNVVMIGPPGTGKTHLAIGLGFKACACGYHVLFKTAATLATELCEAREAYHLSKLEKNLRKVDLLILDELSYLSFNRHQSELLFKVISERAERSSTIVTTNLPFSQWMEMFENETMVAALVDRLTFRSHLLDMNGPSYRLESSLATS